MDVIQNITSDQRWIDSVLSDTGKWFLHMIYAKIALLAMQYITAGLRANIFGDVKKIKCVVELPIIGILKMNHKTKMHT